MTNILMKALVTLMLLVPARLLAAPVEVNIGFPGGPRLIIRQEVKSLQDLKHQNVIQQVRDFSCGSASLATIFNFYLGRPVQETEIIKALLELNREKGTLEKVIERRGFSLLDLKLFAENQGFVATGYRLDFEDLVNLGHPAIVPIIPRGFKHFVVFRGADEKRVYLADPSVGNITESIEQFKRQWYGFVNVALVVVPTEEEKKEGHRLALSELDHIFVAQSGIDSFLDGEGPSIHLNPGEF